MKRAFDVVVSAGAITLLLPFFLLIALGVRLDSPGPVLYRARRVGRGEQLFTLLKFRTMTLGADKLGPGVTGAQDRRITRMGSVLRRTKLDELPQLWNVLRGDMSLVGPRPEDPRYVALYTPQQRLVLNVRPGITSPASVTYRHEEALLTGPDWETTYIQQVMPAKLALDLEYARHPTLRADIVIIARTVWVLFR